MKLLNVGCGKCVHSAWTNIDLVAATPEVRAHDLRKGLPYDDGVFDGVYHSHVLEHLTPDAAKDLLSQCHRVLRVGGILRVVVPDLEGIAKGYLETLTQAADEPTDSRLAKHRWMTLEMIDQMTRQASGGLMGRTIREPGNTPPEFIRQRMGHQVDGNANIKNRKTVAMRISRTLSDARKQMALAAVTIIEGKMGRDAYREGRFRQSGELHRWMYDRISLASLLQEVGFMDIKVCQAHESRIESFDDYQLDREGELVRKPDSLFMEAVKPETAREGDHLLDRSSSDATDLGRRAA